MVDVPMLRAAEEAEQRYLRATTLLEPHFRRGSVLTTATLVIQNRNQ